LLEEAALFGEGDCFVEAGAPGADLSLSTHFAALKDPRVERTKRHRLLDILTIALCAVICGADTWVEIEEFGKVREA